MTLISVIIPTRNEESRLAACLTSVHALFAAAELAFEVIVVDADSHDQTLNIARSFNATCLHSAIASRGAQFALGVQQSRGQHLLFLHADCVLSANSSADLKQLQDFLRDETAQIAKFSVHFDSANWRYKMMDRISQFDSLLSSFGDQGILLRRSFLIRHQLLQAIPLFEDVELFRRARRYSQIRILPITVRTSTRRFERLGFFRTHLRNAMLIGLYVCGLHPEKLRNFYYRSGA